MDKVNMTRKAILFVFDQEDLKALEALKAKLSIQQGKVSNIAAVRYAIRQTLKEES